MDDKHGLSGMRAQTLGRALDVLERVDTSAWDQPPGWAVTQAQEWFDSQHIEDVPWAALSTVAREYVTDEDVSDPDIREALWRAAHPQTPPD